MKLTAEQEQAKAKALTDYYRICFSHPAVEGILMWGFWESANWIRQSSLYRRDWTPAPAAQAYRDLVFNQWRTHWEGKADSNGRCRVRAFYGKYAVTCGAEPKQVLLSKEKGQVTVRPTAQVRGLNRKSGAKYRTLHDFIDNRGPGGYSVGDYTLEGL